MVFSCTAFSFVLFTICGILRTRGCVYAVLRLLWFNDHILNTGLLFGFMEFKEFVSGLFHRKKEMHILYKV